MVRCLNEKSQTKRSQEIAKHNPDTENIFEDNLVDTHYPQRPQEQEDVCLYDFVANYEWQVRDDHRNKLKPRLRNYKLFEMRIKEKTTTTL